MRALITVATAALALGVLAGCGDASTPDASDQTTTTTSEQLATTPGFPATSDVVTTPPSPPPTKPQNPPDEPSVTIENYDFVVPPGVTAVPAWQIEGAALPDDYNEYRDRAWVHEDGFTLELVAFANSGCSGAEAVLVDQSADAVKVLLRPRDSGGNNECTAVMTPRVVVVTLDQPLQDRKILLSAGR